MTGSFGAVSLGRVVLVADGDSRTQGISGLGFADFTDHLTACLFSALVIHNVGVGSRTQATQNSAAATNVDTKYDGTKRENVVVTSGGINDIYAGTSGAATAALIETYCLARQAAGFSVVVCTLPSAATVTGTAETQRQAANAAIRANWASYADALADLDADARLQNPADTTYFSSLSPAGVHYTAAGDRVVAEIAAEALTSIGVT